MPGEWSRAGTPRQRGSLAEFPGAGPASRDALGRARPLGAAALPAPEPSGGFGRSPVSLPGGPPRADPGPLALLGKREDPVPAGDVGTGKTRMAGAPARAACTAGTEARFLAAAPPLARLRRARPDGRPGRVFGQEKISGLGMEIFRVWARWPPYPRPLQLVWLL